MGISIRPLETTVPIASPSATAALPRLQREDNLATQQARMDALFREPGYSHQKQLERLPKTALLNSAQISTVFQRVGTERFGSKGSSFITEVRIVGGWSIASGYTSGHILEDTQHHLPLVETTIKRYQYLQELSPVTDPTRFTAMIHRDQAYDFGVFAVLTNKEFAAEVVQNTVIVPDYDFSPDERYGCLTYPDYHGLSIAYAAIKEPGQGELAESYNFTYFHSQVPNLTYSSGGGVVNDQGHLVGMQHDLAPDGSGLRFTPIPPDHETMRRAVMLELEEQLAGHG